MAEIRVVCPGCAAEYRLPGDAIPPGGREVECSACGHVWHAVPPAARLALVGAVDAAKALPAPLPPPGAGPVLNRPLPSSVLDILHDEVEHERRARAADSAPDRAGGTNGAASVPGGHGGTIEPDWPATTITRHVNWQMALPGPPDPPLPVPGGPAGAMAPVVRPAAAARPGPAPGAGAGRYAAGFGLALALAAAAAGLYALAPAPTEPGALAQGRAQVDVLRGWLQDRTDRLLR